MNSLKKFCIIICVILSINTSHAVTHNEEFKDVSIIIPSCDKYSELWEPFFTFLFKHWPNLNKEYKHIPIYLASNTETYNNPRVRNVLLGDETTGSWSDYMLKFLEHVKTKYVIIILDDYIMTAPVNNKRLAQVLKLMRATKAPYAEIAIDQSLNDGQEVPGYNGIITRARFGPYRTSLQTCIWETEVLKWILKPGETIWDFEVIGTHRTEGIMQPFYLLTSEPVFTYPRRGAVVKGQYQRHVIDYINSQGFKFTPKKLPLEPTYRDKRDQYLTTEIDQEYWDSLEQSNK